MVETLTVERDEYVVGEEHNHFRAQAAERKARIAVEGLKSLAKDLRSEADNQSPSGTHWLAQMMIGWAERADQISTAAALDAGKETKYD